MNSKSCCNYFGYVLIFLAGFRLQSLNPNPALKIFTFRFRSQTMGHVSIKRHFQPFFNFIEFEVTTQMTRIKNIAKKNIYHFASRTPIRSCSSWKLLNHAFGNGIQAGLKSFFITHDETLKIYSPQQKASSARNNAACASASQSRRAG